MIVFSAFSAAQNKHKNHEKRLNVQMGLELFISFKGAEKGLGQRPETG